MLDLLGFAEGAGARLVVTGEGSSTPLCRHRADRGGPAAARAGAPVVAVAGRRGLTVSSSARPASRRRTLADIEPGPERRVRRAGRCWNNDGAIADEWLPPAGSRFGSLQRA